MKTTIGEKGLEKSWQMNRVADKWRELAKRDDVLDQMVPSDVRQLVGDIDRLTDVVGRAIEFVEFVQKADHPNGYIYRTGPELLKELRGVVELRSGHAWVEHFGAPVADPDGWRLIRASMDDEITVEEFARRWSRSTCRKPAPPALEEVLKRVTMGESFTDDAEICGGG